MLVKVFIANLYIDSQYSSTLFESFHKKSCLEKHLKEECGYKQVAENIFEKSFEGKIMKAIIVCTQVQDPYFI